MVSRLIHVNVNCADLDRSLKFYTDVLGARVHEIMESGGVDLRPCMGVGETGAPHYRAALLYFGDARGGPYIDLVEWQYEDGSTERREGRPALEAQDWGLARVALEVPDLEEAYARVSDAGAEIVGPPQDEQLGRWHMKLFLCRDPDGALLEIVEFPEGTRRRSHEDR
jgi:catechol 2,3-dioxygenase-like lactoylglutathione lyase family enzyme